MTLSTTTTTTTTTTTLSVGSSDRYHQHYEEQERDIPLSQGMPLRRHRHPRRQRRQGQRRPQSMENSTPRAISPYDDDDMDDDDHENNNDRFSEVENNDDTDEILLYGGVYYGSDGEPEDMEDSPTFRHRRRQPHRYPLSDSPVNRYPVIDSPVMFTAEIPPVYGGVYYGSDDDDEEDHEAYRIHTTMTDAAVATTATASSALDSPTTPPAVGPGSPGRSMAHVNPPPMDYFAGIQRTSHKQEPPSAATTTNLINNNNNHHKYFSLSDRSVTSSLTNDSVGDMDFHSVSSSIMSVEEREWQRRNREDFLHPVTENEDDGPAEGGGWGK